MNSAAHHRTVGVLQARQRVRDVAQPRAPEQVALLGSPRLVGELLNSAFSTPIERASAGVARRSLAEAGVEDLAPAAAPRPRTAAAGSGSPAWCRGTAAGRPPAPGRTRARTAPGRAARACSGWRTPAPCPASAWSAGACPGSSDSACSRLASCEEIAWKFVFEELISEVSVPSTEPSARVTSCRLWIERRMFALRCTSSRVNVPVSRFSGAKRLNVPPQVRDRGGAGRGAAGARCRGTAAPHRPAAAAGSCACRRPAWRGSPRR